MESVFQETFEKIILNIEQKLSKCDNPADRERLKKRLQYLRKKYMGKEQQTETV